MPVTASHLPSEHVQSEGDEPILLHMKDRGQAIELESNGAYSAAQ